MQAEALGGWGGGKDWSGTPFGKFGEKEWMQLAIEMRQLDAQPVPARRAGRADLHGQDRRDRAVDRRQVLRRHPGDGRGPPRRGVRQVPQREARRAVPDQRPPADAARRHHRGQPLGHDLPGHADHGGGPGPRRLRLHAADDPRPAAEEAAPLRHERRGPPRGLRRALPQGVLRRPRPGRDPRPPGVRLRGRRAHARPLHAARGVGPHGHGPQGDPPPRARGRGPAGLPGHALQQDRAQLQEAGAASTPATAGCATASSRWV